MKHAALAQQISEHQESHQGHGLRGDEAYDDGNRDGKRDSHAAAHVAGIVLHVDAALLFRGHQLDCKRLDNGHQGHVGVGGHRDWAHVVGAQHLGNQDGGGAVRRADDSDGSRIL